MLGVSKIVSIEYNTTNKLYCDKCELYEWNHIISFKGGGKHLLCDGCVRFFINMKYKEMAGIRDIERVHSPHEIISTVFDFPYKIIEKCFQ